MINTEKIISEKLNALTTYHASTDRLNAIMKLNGKDRTAAMIVDFKEHLKNGTLSPYNEDLMEAFLMYALLTDNRAYIDKFAKNANACDMRVLHDLACEACNDYAITICYKNEYISPEEYNATYATDSINEINMAENTMKGLLGEIVFSKNLKPTNPFHNNYYEVLNTKPKNKAYDATLINTENKERGEMRLNTINVVCSPISVSSFEKLIKDENQSIIRNLMECYSKEDAANLTTAAINLENYELLEILANAPVKWNLRIEPRRRIMINHNIRSEETKAEFNRVKHDLDTIDVSDEPSTTPNPSELDSSTTLTPVSPVVSTEGSEAPRTWWETFFGRSN